mmetsp:Transcript_57735/g.162839  ORF Transcript_57735/g.162839 Transcript_57735/m.162839 type:complete len:82 (-) Transcript_57735:99-344(-)
MATQGQPPGQVIVAHIAPAGLAHAAGLQAGDEVAALNGLAVAGMSREAMSGLIKHERPLQVLVHRGRPGAERATARCVIPG